MGPWRQGLCCLLAFFASSTLAAGQGDRWSNPPVVRETRTVKVPVSVRGQKRIQCLSSLAETMASSIVGAASIYGEFCRATNQAMKREGLPACGANLCLKSLQERMDPNTLKVELSIDNNSMPGGMGGGMGSGGPVLISGAFDDFQGQDYATDPGLDFTVSLKLTAMLTVRPGYELVCYNPLDSDYTRRILETLLANQQVLNAVMTSCGSSL